MNSAVHLALSRDEAKQLFSSRSDEDLTATLESLCRDCTSAKDRLAHSHYWELLQAVLSGSPEPGAGEMPLNQVVLGGRPLYRGDDRHVMLVRPDLVAHVADAVEGISESDFKDRCRASTSDSGNAPEEERCQAAWQELQQIGQLFRHAASGGDCVVFAS